MSKLLMFTFTVIIILSGCTSKNLQSNLHKHFVKHFDKSNSKIFKDCAENSDCKLILLGVGCSYFESINVNNSESSILEYMKKEKELTKGVLFDCMMSPNIDTLKAVCEDNVCAVKIKK